MNFYLANCLKKTMKKHCFSIFISLIWFACQSPKEDPKSFSLTLKDSIYVDQLDPRYLVDYDRVNGKYLLSNNSYYEYLELDKDGKKLYEGKFPFDGPEAVDMIFGLGYYQGKVAIATLNDGFLFYEKGKKISELKIPYAYGSSVFLTQLSLMNWNGGVLYPKFLADSLLSQENSSGVYDVIYRSPLMEFQKEGEEIRTMVVLPEDSHYRNGNFHGELILVPMLDGKDFYLLTWNRPEILKYVAQEEGFVYDKTVKLDLDNWVPYTEVPMANSGQFYDSFSQKRPGSVSQLLKFGEYFLLYYQAGISEIDLQAIKGENGQVDPQLAYEKNPPLLAVLDSDLNILAQGLKFPSASSGMVVVSNENEVVIAKNPFFAEKEDPGLILYRLNLQVK